MTRSWSLSLPPLSREDRRRLSHPGRATPGRERGPDEEQMSPTRNLLTEHDGAASVMPEPTSRSTCRGEVERTSTGVRHGQHWSVSWNAKSPGSSLVVSVA